MDSRGRATDAVTALASQHYAETTAAATRDRQRSAVEIAGGDPDDPRHIALAAQGVPPAYAGSPLTWLAQQIAALDGR